MYHDLASKSDWPARDRRGVKKDETPRWNGPGELDGDGATQGIFPMPSEVRDVCLVLDSGQRRTAGANPSSE